MPRTAAAALAVLFACGAPEETPEQRGERVRAERDAKDQAVQLHQLVEQYALAKRACPADVADLKSAGILTRIEPDPWGADYVIACELGSASAITVRSHGRDGKPGTDDDVSSR